MGTFKTYEEFSGSNVSEKILIAHVHATKRISGFTSEGANLYKKKLQYVLIELRDSAILLNSVSSLGALTTDGEYFFDINSYDLYVYSNTPLEDHLHIGLYRLFFSNNPIDLSFDLGDLSPQVIYEPRISSAPSFKSELAEASKSSSITGSGTLVLESNDGWFNDKYDKLTFENQLVEVYSHHRDLKPSQAQVIFRGVISTKSYSKDSVSFQLKDDFYSLNRTLPLSKFEGEVIKADAQKLKRRVYGKVSGLRVQSTDQIGDGFYLTGTIQGTRKTNIIKGVGTSFLSEASPSDEVFIGESRYSIKSVESDTSLTITNEIEMDFSGQYVLLPKIPYYKHNRSYHVAHHQLKRYSSTITYVIQRNRVTVDDPTGLEVGDLVLINGERATIKRISFNNITFTQNLSTLPLMGDPLVKSEIQEVYVRDQRIDPTDYTVISTSDTRITLSNSAEFNQSPTSIIDGNYTFIFGSRKVWLGVPCFFNLACVANTSDSLVGKYLTIYDESGTLAVWFAKLLDPALPQTTEPVHGASKSLKITLSGSNLTASEVADQVANGIRDGVYIYDAYVSSGSNVQLESVQGIDLALGSSGTSGFSVTKTKVGSVSPLEINLTARLSSRDWIKSSDSVDADYYEILDVFEKSLVLRTPFSLSSRTTGIRARIVDYAEDDTNVSVIAYGKTKDGTSSGDLISTAAEVVEDLLLEAGYGEYYVPDSIAKSSSACDYLVSLPLPLSASGASPSIKDVINLLNGSIKGSLLLNRDLKLEYTTLDSEIDFSSLDTIKEDEVISASIQSDTDLLSRYITTKYRPQDVVIGSQESGFNTYTYESEFVANYIGSAVTSEQTLYLFSDSDASEMTERIQFYNSLSNTKVTIKGPLSLGRFSVGEKVALDLDFLFTSKGSSDGSKRVGIVSKMIKNGKDVELVVTDLGNLFNRAAIITSDSTPAHSLASNDERLQGSFITSTDGLIDNDENTSDTNLIS